MKGIPFIWTEYENFSGANIGFIKGVNGDNKGADITGFIKSVNGDNKGADITGLFKGVNGDNKGADITGLFKGVNGDNKGLSLTGGFNYFRKVNEWSISYATLSNVVKEKGENSFGLQIGLYNKAGDQYCPIVNIWGLKNAYKKARGIFNKNKQKDKLEEKIKE